MRLRKTTIEPIFDLIAKLIDTTDNHKQIATQSLDNVRTYLALAVFTLQLAMIMNSVWGLPIRAIAHIKAVWAGIMHTPQLIIPQLYIELVFSLVYFAFKVEKTEQNISKIPPLECLLEYDDIGGAKHSIKFALNVNWFHIDNGAYFEGFLDSSLEESRV